MARSVIQERSGIIGSHRGLPKNFFLRSENRKLVSLLEEGLEQVEERLNQDITFVDEFAQISARYLFEAGGKRVRPTLTLLAAQLGVGVTEQVIVSAQVVEMTHLASLYHDDVMDDAQVWRGIPAAHSVWGNSVAVLTGDLLFARASRLVASLGQRAIDLQAETFERLCLGQLREMVGPKEGEDPIAHYLHVLKDKTGSLISVSARLGVIFGNADPAFEQPVFEFGEKIGIAFQLIDDVIDLSAEGVKKTGKTPGNDLRAGVPTMPLLKLQEQARSDAKAEELLFRLEQHVMGTADDGNLSEQATQAIEDLRQHEGTEYTKEQAHQFAQEAVNSLATIPDGVVKETLIRFAQSVVDRGN